MMILKFEGKKDRENEEGGSGGDYSRSTLSLTIILKTAQRTIIVKRDAQHAFLPTGEVQERP